MATHTVLRKTSGSILAVLYSKSIIFEPLENLSACGLKVMKMVLTATEIPKSRGFLVKAKRWQWFYTDQLSTDDKELKPSTRVTR